MENINRAIELKDLKVGDEVLVGSSGLRYFTILKAPSLRTKTHTYNTGTYKAIKVNETYKNFIGYMHLSDYIKYYDFNYATIWLVKRKDDYES